MAHDIHRLPPYIYTLKLSDIKGESALKDHEDEIVVDKVIQQYEIPEELDVFADGAERRPAVLCEGITVVKKYEKSTPPLLTALTEGTQISEGVISCIALTHKLFLTIKLVNAVVRQADLYFEPEGSLVEVNFSYEEITHTYSPEGAGKTIFTYKTYEFP